ncbi:MAG: DUF1836 domain-containing protein [Firmicutes bacterium]|nr:DUF1836 domain-containing protein [Bacillota bacterium]
MGDGFAESKYMKEILEFHCPRYDELPNLDLYMDQVLSIIEEVLKPFSFDEKLLTSSMVNNYVKQRVIAPPVNKKYSRDQLVYLLTVCILKKVFSISEIYRMITIQMETSPIETAYNTFCDMTEQALRMTFTGETFPERTGKKEEVLLMGSAIMSFAQKVLAQKYLEYRLEKDHSEEV